MIVAVATLWFLARKSPVLAHFAGEGNFRPKVLTLKKALRLALPVGAERVLMCGAQIASTAICTFLREVARFIRMNPLN